MELSGLTTMLHEQAGHLSHGAKQALELAMVLAQEPTVLLLDEPTAGLTRDERAAIGSVLTELAQVLKEHDRLMQAVLADVLNQRSKPASFKQWKHVGEGMELVISSSSRNSAKRS